MRPLYSTPFCFVINTIFQNCHGASLFYQDVMHMPWHHCWNPKKSSIFHEFHTSYWLIKYLNPKLYICIPSKYILIPFKSLTNSYNTITILQYTSIYIHIRWNYLKTSLFRTFLSCYHTISPKLSWRLIILPRCHALAMTSLLESKNQTYSKNPIHLID
jgi:hypothetical protein